MIVPVQHKPTRNRQEMTVLTHHAAWHLTFFWNTVLIFQIIWLSGLQISFADWHGQWMSDCLTFCEQHTRTTPWMKRVFCFWSWCFPWSIDWSVDHQLIDFIDCFRWLMWFHWFISFIDWFHRFICRLLDFIDWFHRFILLIWFISLIHWLFFQLIFSLIFSLIHFIASFNFISLIVSFHWFILFIDSFHSSLFHFILCFIVSSFLHFFMQSQLHSQICCFGEECKSLVAKGKVWLLSLFLFSKVMQTSFQMQTWALCTQHCNQTCVLGCFAWILAMMFLLCVNLFPCWANFLCSPVLGFVECLPLLECFAPAGQPKSVTPSARMCCTKIWCCSTPSCVTSFF